MIAARDALRVLELTEQVAAALAIACRQAIRLRLRAGEIAMSDLEGPLAGFVGDLEAAIPFIEEDRPLDRLLRDLCAGIDRRAWALDWPFERAGGGL
ncbi:MAG: hypothetical protein Q7U42_00130 [Parvibaculum sp.]|nr:hypothetical protein [Parvibaculum sp.]